MQNPTLTITCFICVLAVGAPAMEVQAGGPVLTRHSIPFVLENTGGGVADGRLRFYIDTLAVPGEDYYIDNAMCLSNDLPRGRRRSTRSSAEQCPRRHPCGLPRADPVDEELLHKHGEIAAGIVDLLSLLVTGADEDLVEPPRRIPARFESALRLTAWGRLGRAYVNAAHFNQVAGPSDLTAA